ncbi:MAG: hypothetical protein KAH77_08915 [Thiomargarita sp.]|nr:hypothetical protein [Thiomargarita sp.]
MNINNIMFIMSLSVSTILMSACSVTRCGGAQNEGVDIQQTPATAHYCRTYTKDTGRIHTQAQLDTQARSSLQAAIETKITSEFQQKAYCQTYQSLETCQTSLYSKMKTYVEGSLKNVTLKQSDPTDNCTCVTLSTTLQALQLAPFTKSPVPQNNNDFIIF